MVSQKGWEQGKRFGVLAVLMAAVFLVFMGTQYGLRSRRSGPEYGLSGNIGKAGDSLNIPVTLENYTGASLNADLEITAMPEDGRDISRAAAIR